MASLYPLEYGLHDLEDRRARTVSEVGEQLIRDRVQTWLEAYTEENNKFLDAVLARDPVWNTTPISRTRYPYMVDYNLVDEDGKADPVNNYLTYPIGLPLARRELAQGWSWERGLVRTVNDINEWLIQIRSADMIFFRQQAKKALFYNTGWTYYSVDEDGNMPLSIPISPLANNDAQVYPLRSGSMAQAQHYTAQSAQVADATNPFPTIKATMTRYSFTTPLTPRLVSFVAGAALIAGIQSLATFEDYVAPTYYIAGAGQGTLSQAILQEQYFGNRVIGQDLATGIVVVEWDDLPDNTILTMDMNNKPLGLRETPEPQRRGLLFKNGILSHYGNEEVERVRRIAGIGVVNRTAAHIHQTATGGTTYTLPAGYTPLV